MLKLLALALLGVVFVYGQDPHHCVVHPELTFHALQYDHEFTTFRRYDAEYDGRGHKVAFYEKERAGTGVQLIWFIGLYEQEIGYEINIKTKVCKKFKIGKFFPWAVPHDAKFMSDFYIGGPGEDVEVVEWYHGTSKQDHQWVGGFSRRQCYPLNFWQRNNHNNRTMTTRYYNIVNGITEPKRFIPPPECIQAEFEEATEQTQHLFRMMY